MEPDYPTLIAACEAMADIVSKNEKLARMCRNASLFDGFHGELKWLQNMAEAYAKKKGFTPKQKEVVETLYAKICRIFYEKNAPI